MDTWVSELQRRLQALEIDSSLHTPAADEDTDEESEQPPKVAAEVVSRYEEALKLLAGEIELLPQKLGDESLRSVVKEMVCQVVVWVSAHLGRHYWTSPSSRTTAKDVLDRVMAACGCSSTLELLIGRSGSHDSSTTQCDSHMTSPYVSMATRAEETTDLSRKYEVASGERETASKEREDLGREEKLSGKDREKISGRVGMVFSGGVIKPLLLLLRSKLTKETWKKQPAAKHALIWTLRQLKHPHLSPHLNSFLPPLLMLVDDHESYHKTLGVSGLSHLISNTDPTELRWYSRSEVIYEAIKSMLYIREVAIIHSLHSCLLLLLPVIEGPPPTTVTMPRKPTRTDEVFRILLNNIDMESKIALRKAYIAHVSRYIELLGIFTARHMKVMRVIGGCLEFPDYCGEQTRIWTLKTLLVLMRHVWPRVPSRRSEILKMLLRLVSDLCPQEDFIPDKPEIVWQLELVSECFLMLQHCCGNMEDVYRSLQRDCGSHKGLLSCLETSLVNMEHGQSREHGSQTVIKSTRTFPSPL